MQPVNGETNVVEAGGVSSPFRCVVVRDRMHMLVRN